MKGFSLCNYFVIDILHKPSLIGVKEEIGEEKYTICSYENSDDLLKHVICELDKYVSIRNFIIY